MRLAFTILPLTLITAGCSIAADVPAKDPKTIALEYSASDAEAADKAQTECGIYGLSAKQREAAADSTQTTIIFDCQ